MRKTEVISRNEFDKSYLLIEKKDLEENYVFKMLTQNNIEGIPECKVRYLDEKTYLAYDVTAKKTLEKTYTDQKMNFEDLTELFYGISRIMHCANDYLLDREGFLLHPKYMFSDLETGKWSCLYYPQQASAMGEERYRPLSDFLLDRIDHKDEHAVTIAYHFYKISKEEYFSFESFIGFMEKECLLVQSETRKKEVFQKEEQQINFRREIITEDEVESDKKECPDKPIKWRCALGFLLVGVGLSAGYGLIPILKEFAVYVLVPGITMVIVAFAIFVHISIEWYKEKNMDMYEEPEEPVRVEDYFEDMADDVTVFFDQDEYLTLKWKEGHFSKEYVLEEFPVTVGKMKGSVQVVIDDRSISRLHARFRKQGNTIYLQDLDSTNGTYVNEKQLFAGEERIIKRGDEIQFGKIIVNVV